MEAIAATSRTASIFLGGELCTTPAPQPRSFIIAADSGYDHALAQGFAVDFLIGDLDSISDHGLAHAERNDVTIERHDSDKDETDLELAMLKAVARGSRRIDLFGGEAGRLDHLLGIASALTDRRFSDIDIVWHTCTGQVRPISDGGTIEVDVAIGTTVSLVAMSDTTGVSTSGMTWALSGATLARGTSRGLRNTTNARPASVSVDTGALLVIVEGTT
ncbi:MAG: thiamine diphosphokinase [Acidimicrobiia bacterium]